MRLTVAVLLLVGSAVSSKKNNDKTEPSKPDKRDLLEGNYGDRTYLKNVLRSIQGIDYAESETDGAKSSPTYSPSSHRIAKISDVLTSEGPHYSAISDHLFSPVSAYQSRISSSALGENSELSFADFEHKPKPSKKHKKPKNPLKRTNPSSDPSKNFQFDTIPNFANHQQDVSPFRHFYQEPHHAFDRSLFTPRAYHQPSAFVPPVARTVASPHYYPHIYQRPVAYPSQGITLREFAEQPIQYFQQHQGVPIYAQGGRPVLPTVSYAQGIQQIVPSAAYAQGAPQVASNVAYFQSPQQVGPSVAYAKTPQQGTPGASYAQTPQQITPGSAYAQTPQQVNGLAYPQSTQAPTYAYAQGSQQAAPNVQYLQVPQQVLPGITYAQDTFQVVPNGAYAPGIQQLISGLAYAQSTPQVPGVAYAQQQQQQVESTVQPYPARVPEQQPATQQQVNVQQQHNQGAVSYASFSQSLPSLAQGQQYAGQEQQLPNQYVQSQAQHLPPPPRPDQEVPDSQPQPQQVAINPGPTPQLNLAEQQSAFRPVTIHHTYIPQDLNKQEVNEAQQAQASSHPQPEASNQDPTAQPPPQPAQAVSTEAPVQVTTVHSVQNQPQQGVQEVGQQPKEHTVAVEKELTYIQQVPSPLYSQELVYQQPGLVQGGVTPSFPSVQYFGNFAETLFGNYNH